jgi:hypothetical protein
MNHEKSQSQLPLAQVKGSWEERIARVARLLSNDDPTALAQSQALIDRLSRIPAAQRAAANQRLDRALLVALQNQARHQAATEQYLAAAATLSAGVQFFADELAFDLQVAACRYQVLEPTQRTVALDALAAAGDDIEAWGELVAASLRVGAYEYAQRGLTEAEHWINLTYQAQLDTPAARRDQAMLAHLKARYAVRQADFAAAVAWYEFASTLDTFWLDNPQFLYRDLLTHGAFAEAESLIRRDMHEIRANFWRGLLEYRKGRFEQASRFWLKVTQGEFPNEDSGLLLEVVLSHYYLGDEASTGLSIVMETLDSARTNWGPFFLAGLGWAMRGEIGSARQDISVATKLYRADGIGARLPWESWLFCCDLLGEEARAQIKEFFDDSSL